MGKLLAIAKERDGSQLAVFPEAFIGGYPKYHSFEAVVGERTLAGRQEFLHYYEGSIAVPSAATERIEELSKTTGIFIVVGVIERDGSTLYCTALLVDPTLGLVGKHRKLVPTASERLIWGQGDGSTLPVISSTIGSAEAKISTAICWENYMPLLRLHYYSKHVQLYCAPTVDAREVWQSTMTHIALEGRCFVLAACPYATEGDYPSDHPVSDVNDRDPSKVMIGGGSVIISPLGKVLAGPLRGQEGILTAEIDLDECIRGKFDLDVVGHYARPDVFPLSMS